MQESLSAAQIKRALVAPSVLPKPEWAIAQPAHLPVAPLLSINGEIEIIHIGIFKTA